MAFGSLLFKSRRNNYDINAPELPRKGKAPACFEIGSSHVARAFLHVKTYLRSTMTQARLNHLLILHCHKDKTDL